MMKMLPSPILLFGLIGFSVLAGCHSSRAGYESAPYQVVRQDGRFEVRDYPALIIVETSMSADNSDGSFGRLFRFISGTNQKSEKIAMTTPVFLAEDGSTRTMAFVMPATMGKDQVPAPTDGTVAVRELPPGRFAVLRFSGGRNGKNEAKHLEELKTWMANNQIPITSASPIYGYFDPPWIPTFLRRNEVMLQTGP